MFRVLFVLPLWCGFCSAASPAVDPESVEPPLGFAIQLGDQSIRLHEGESAKLNGKFENPEVKLISDDFRTFPYAGVSFRYPKHFAFEADFELEGRRYWALDGNNCVISIHAHTARLTVTEFAELLVDQYGAANCRVTDTTLTLANQTLKGKRVEASIATSKIVQEVFLLPTGRTCTLLMLQDTPGKDGAASEERRIAGNLLSKSFAVSPK